MKNFKLSFLMLMTLVFSAASAQVPSYVPSSGLVGWWPFNGNANDESGNGNNGTVNGATPTTDRFGIQNSAYNYNGTSSYIRVPSLAVLDNSLEMSISLWIKPIDTTGFRQFLISRSADLYSGGFFISHESNQNSNMLRFSVNGYNTFNLLTSKSYQIPYVKWQHIAITKSKTQIKYYVDGQLTDSALYTDKIAANSDSVYFGIHRYRNQPAGFFPYYFKGLLDDIGTWNRALTNTEVQSLYKGCNLFEVTGNPTDSKLKSTQNATFTTAAVSGSTIQWQSNADNLGWTNVPANSFYSGGTTASLTINNVQISNHNQKFRAIATNGPCKDTSTEAKIIITDTCINTKSVSVADTLKFAVNLTGVAPPNNRNAMKVYPNPTNSEVVIDNGNFTAMANYIIKIENSIGQQVFFSKVTQQQFTVDVSTLGGKGVYTLSVMDPAGKLLETKKIVLQ